MALLLAAMPGCRGREKQPDIAGLIADLQSRDSQKSGRASLALITIGEPAVPALVELLKSDDARLRSLAASTIWGMGSRARAAAPALGGALADPDAELRVAAAMALENMGADARPAVSALIRALRDRDNRVRQAAVKALGRIGPGAREAIPALERVLKKGSWPEAEEALRLIRGSAGAGAAASSGS